MAILEKTQTNPQKSGGLLPLPASVLYWYVFDRVDHYLKDRTQIDTRFHGTISKFLAGLWRFHYEQDTMHRGSTDAGTDLARLPFDSTLIPLSYLSTINRWVEQDVRLLVSKDHASDQSIKIMTILQMGKISQLVKKVIKAYQMDWLAPSPAINDNQ